MVHSLLQVEVKMAKLIGQHWETFEKKTDNQEQKKVRFVYLFSKGNSASNNKNQVLQQLPSEH